MLFRTEPIEDAARRERIVSEARKLVEDDPRFDRLDIWVAFGDKDLPTIKEGAGALIRELDGLVPTTEFARIEQGRRCLFWQVTIWPSESGAGAWRAVPKSECAEPLTRDVLQQAVARKDVKIANYRERCTEAWLLLVLPLFPAENKPAFGQWTWPESGKEWQLTTGFDRVFAACGLLDRVTGKRVVVSLDGGRVRVRRKKRGPKTKKGRNRFHTDWKEPKLLILYVVGDDGRPSQTWAPIIDGTLRGPEAVFALLLSYARQIGLNAADKVLFIADGAPWIWRRLQRLIAALGLSPTQVLGLIDFYHAAKQLSDAVKLRRWSATQRTRWLNRTRGLFEERFRTAPARGWNEGEWYASTASVGPSRGHVDARSRGMGVARSVPGDARRAVRRCCGEDGAVRIEGARRRTRGQRYRRALGRKECRRAPQAPAEATCARSGCDNVHVAVDSGVYRGGMGTTGAIGLSFPGRGGT